MEKTSRFSSFGIILVIAWVVVALPLIQTVPGSPHALERHGNDRVTPSDIQEKLGQDPNHEIWLSLAQDKMLYLVHICIDVKGRDIWGARIIGATTHTEITSFARDRKMWNKVILRDKYAPVNEAARAAMIRYGLQSWEDLPLQGVD